MIPHKELEKTPEFWLGNIQDELYAKAKAYMYEKGINQTQLAKELGVSRAYISQIMNGSFNFTLQKLIELSLHLGFAPVLKFIPIESPENSFTKKSKKQNKLTVERQEINNPKNPIPYLIPEDDYLSVLNEHNENAEI